MQDTTVSAMAAIIGAGTMGKTHAAAYRSAGARVVAVCDVNSVQADALAAEVGATAYHSVDDLLAAVRPTVISICTPPADHVAAACRVLQRGIPVLCEKPLAESVAGAQAIVMAAQEGGTVCMTGFCHRFHEPVLQIKDKLERGEVGEPVLFRNRFAHYFHGVGQTWFADPGVSGGGTLMDTSVHSLDLYRFLIGEISHVAAELTTVTPGLNVEDNSVLLVNGPSGVPGIIEASWTTPIGESMLVIYGTKGTLTVDYAVGDFGIARIQRASEPAPEELPRSANNRFTAEIAHLIHCINAGLAPSPDGHDGLRVLQVIEAAYHPRGRSGCADVPA